MSAALPHQPPEHVVDRLGRDDDVERRRHRATLLEVAHPELTPSELPLSIGTLLPTGSEVIGHQAGSAEVTWRCLSSERSLLSIVMNIKTCKAKAHAHCPLFN